MPQHPYLLLSLALALTVQSKSIALSESDTRQGNCELPDVPCSPATSLPKPRQYTSTGSLIVTEAAATLVTTTTVVIPLTTTAAAATSIINPSSTPPITTSIPLGPNLCWTLPECVDAFTLVQSCYGTTGGMVDPNDVSQSQAYRTCLCDQNLPGNIKNADTTWNKCSNCYIQGGIELSLVNALSASFHNFCGTQDPSLYLFLIDLLNFLQLAHPPTSFTAITGAITQITTLSTLFTPYGDLNKWPSTGAPGVVASTLLGTSLTMPVATSSIATSTASTVSTPSPSPSPSLSLEDVMSLLPTNWPFDGAPPRRPGQRVTATASRDGAAVALVVSPELGWWCVPLDGSPVKLQKVDGEEEGRREEL